MEQGSVVGLLVLLAGVALSAAADNPFSISGVTSLAKTATGMIKDNAVVGNISSATNGVGRVISKEIAAAKHPVEEGLVYIGSSQCAGVKKIFGVSYEQIEGEREPDLNQLTLEYRDAEIRTIYNINSAARRIVQSREFNPSRNLIIFIHGFTDDPTRESFRTISDSLLKEGEYNVLALDGSSLIRWLYLRSTTYVRFMGEKLAEVIAAMVNSGGNPAAVHIIGHSLGAHVSGFTGKTFTSLTGLKVGRISGLDPAGPCFSHVDSGLRLKATDADFVDVMHTDGGVFGLKDPVGHVDYYPNGGSLQPNCLWQTCSHSRAWVYYAESVERRDSFPAVRCADYDAFRKGNCDKEISFMGYGSVPGTTGKYYLQTGEDSPYSLGFKGATYNNNEGVLRSIGASVFG